MSIPGLAIDLADVSKTYKGRVHALNGISLRVHAGEIFGLLGPNGAGKSTLIKIMMTLVRPTRANGSILGKPVGDKGTLKRVGYLPENHRFPRHLTGGQVLDLFGALVCVTRADRKRRAGALLDLVGMGDWAHKRIGTYSKGMMQRVGLAAALMADPDLLLLDEPTDGVDPMARKQIRDVLEELKRRGKSVFVNSHQLSELEQVSDRVAILVGGQVVKQGTLAELAIGKGRYEIQIGGHCAEPGIAALLARFPAGVATGDVFTLPTTEAAEMQPVIDALRGAGVTVRRVQGLRPTLEEMFMEAVHASGQGFRAGAVSVGKTASPPPVTPVPVTR